MELYPIQFEPIFKERIWGGRRLKELFGKDLPADKPIGESWELADLPEGKSTIANGPLAGKTLAGVVADYGHFLTGNPDYQPPFPLLIKLLDAKDTLSVQVHPDKEACERMGKGDPKTECWYIIDCPQDGYIYKGLKPGTTREQFAESVKNGTVEQYLQKILVRKGECHFLPSGTCHAIGPNLVIAEIQQPSDTTYRVFDWNRVDPATGQGRQLHIEEALESTHFDSSKDNLTVTTVGRLVDAPEFKVDKGHQTAGCEVLLSPGKMKVLVFLSGRGRITGPGAEAAHFAPGQTILIPARYEGVIRFTEETEYLTVQV